MLMYVWMLACPLESATTTTADTDRQACVPLPTEKFPCADYENTCTLIDVDGCPTLMEPRPDLACVMDQTLASYCGAESSSSCPGFDQTIRLAGWVDGTNPNAIGAGRCVARDGIRYEYFMWIGAPSFLEVQGTDAIFYSHTAWFHDGKMISVSALGSGGPNDCKQSCCNGELPHYLLWGDDLRAAACLRNGGEHTPYDSSDFH